MPTVAGVMMKISCGFAVAIILAGTVVSTQQTVKAQERPWSERAADSAMSRWPKGHIAAPEQQQRWVYELGTLLDGMDNVWLNTADERYFNYIQGAVDSLITPDGNIPTYKAEENQLDSILMGRQALLLYGVTHDKKYLKAAELMYKQLQQQPRTASGGFWHKQIYPNQMWLDGLYMAEPFYAQYATISHHPEQYKDIVHQFVLVEQHVRDPKTGLLYHGWDESKQQRWANKETGLSQEVWGRAMGWYMMALVDTLDYLPTNDPGRQKLIAILQREADAVAKYQDAKTGLWYLVMDKPTGKGNYLESSAACMFVYSLAKGVRLGYLPAHYRDNAEHGWKGILSHHIQVGPGNDVSLTDTVRGAGLGGNPYRDGTYAYYVGEKIGTNDSKGVGAFLLASVEMENAENARLGRGDVVLMDGWYNSQQREDAFGQKIYYHYKWDYLANEGYSLLGDIFLNHGAELQTLYTAPTVANLSKAKVYIIVSPDIPSKNPNPNYSTAQDAKQVAAWVKAGGVLVVMANDPDNTTLEHLNMVTDGLGIHFNDVLRKHVEGTKWEMGKITTTGGGPMFRDPHTIYMKDVCTITAKTPGKKLLQDQQDVMIASIKYGKGTVVAVTDPWLYNEYIDGRKLPSDYDNYAAGKEFVRYILTQVPK